MAFTNKPYCTVDDVKAAYGSSSTKDDDLIQSLIPLAQEKIDAYVGFPFQTDGPAATRTYDGNGAEQLLTDRLLTLQSVQIQTYSFSTDPGTGAVTRSTDTPTDITGAVVAGPPNTSPTYLLQHLLGCFPLGKRNIIVTGTFGFATVPERVKRACVLEVIAMLDAKNRGFRSQIAAPNSQGTVSQSDDVCREARELLDRFRRIKFRMA